MIDNFGDVGVCWRLAADLAARGHTVRLWLDDARALAWMAPGALQGQWPRVTVHPWNAASDPGVLSTMTPAQVWIEGFGCELPEAFVAWRAGTTEPAPMWINLEYLSAESFVERSHGLPSPLMSGPAKGWIKHFFYPGFTPRTGGLLREPNLLTHRRKFGNHERKAFLQGLGIADHGEALVTLFCYAHAPVAELLAHLQGVRHGVHLLVTHGQAVSAVKAALAHAPQAADGLRITHLPLLRQSLFDQLLWVSDLNFVRGEDSLVRALWSGRPFVWQIYPQDDGAHRAKLEAFLSAVGAPAPVRDRHLYWNSFGLAGDDLPLPRARLEPRSEVWEAWAAALAPRLAQQADLVTQLYAFVQGVASEGQALKTR